MVSHVSLTIALHSTEMQRLVITLISNPDIFRLQDSFINQLQRALHQAGANTHHTNWLAEGEACDIPFDSLHINNAKAICLSHINGAPIDYIIQPEAGRQKKMLISDMDSTIINQECIDEIAATLGIKDKVADITERAMNGELDFSDSLRERVSLLKGVPEEALGEIYQNHITFTDGAQPLLATCRAKDIHTVLVSGGFTFFTGNVSKELGFYAHHANTLLWEDGKLTGNVQEPILDKDAKVHFLKQHASEQQITIDDVIAVGDGANDLPMLQTAGLGVAFKAKPIVKEQANAYLDHTGLTSLLYAMGFKQSDIKECL